MQPKQLTDLVQFIRSTNGEHDDLAATILKLAADSITLETLRSLSPPERTVRGTRTDRRSEEEKTGTLSFTKKELECMPKSFQKAFIVDNRIVKFRFYQGLFQARYRKQGYNIEVASKDFETMKKKFIEKLTGEAEIKELPAADPKRRTAKNILFADYATEWLKIKEQTTKPTTFREYSRMFETNLRPTFGHLHLAEITRPLVQQYLFTFVEAGKYRTAEKLKLMLGCIFDMAAEDFALPSPMKKIVLPYHESKKGSALTKDEERQLIESCRNRKDDVASALLVLLYFGLRQSELPSLNVADGFLECETSKERMGRNVTLRRIPFTPVFRRVQNLVDFEKAKNVNIYKLRSAFKRLFPSHHPHELRYTFITRCKECGVNHELVMLWDGHSGDKDVKTSAVDRGYTDYSKEYILAEAEKVNYDL